MAVIPKPFCCYLSSVFLFLYHAQITLSCDEKFSLAERRDRSDVIVTGIATKTEEDSATVEIIQILRDRFSTLDEKSTEITVGGIKNPNLCGASLSVNLVKIFPLSVRQGDQFYLNSSVIDVSLDSINVIREGGSVKEDRCEDVVCEDGKVCELSESKKAECVCETCPEDEQYSPICATNNVVYPNKCQMKNAACRLDTEISVQNEGFCEDPCSLVKCGFGAECVPSPDRKTATCECGEVCPAVFDPICSDEGTQFDNSCEMMNYMCRNQVSLGTKYESECNPCKNINCPDNTKCKVDPKSRYAVCSCGEKCLAEENTVCGSDGYDYMNECELQRQSCLLNRKIEIVARHSCQELPNDPCSLTICSNYAECRRSSENPNVAECACPFVCDEIYEPVCGQDDNHRTLQQFDNECKLRLTSCNQQRSISLVSRSVCAKISGSTSIASPCEFDFDSPDFGFGSTAKTCDMGKECSISQSNNAVCVCARSCSEYGYNPVCGSDSRSYPNVCELKRSACLNKRQDLVKIRDGACPNACNDVKCENYAECRTDALTEEAKCVCPTQCAPSDVGTDRVCGSNGESYQNLCEMKKVACQTGKKITVSYYGLCFNKDACETKNCHKYATCQKGTCVCENCHSVVKNVVCGSDGINYANECEMRKQACVENLDISVAHYGSCLSSDDEGNENASQKLKWKCSEECMHGNCFLVDGIWQCLCPKCEDEPQINTLCGEDNETYPSKCHLKQTMCMQHKEVGILHYGSCEDVVGCPINSEIIRLSSGGGFLSCNNDEHCPVSSYCFRGECCFYRSKAAINCTTTVYGCCQDQITFALGPRRQGCPENCLCNSLGSYGNRCDMFNQCVCRKGVTGKKCDRCSHGFWNFTRMKDVPYLGCQECNCNINGSQRTDCDQTTGDCLCKPGVFGKKCNLCPEDLVLSPVGCVSESELATQMFYKSCENVKCDHGATCVQREAFAHCECPIECPKESDLSPVVCGSDGRTYIHECDMIVKGCAQGRTLSVSYYGACTIDTLVYENSDEQVNDEAPFLHDLDVADKCKRLNCKHGGQCAEVGSKAKCLCPIGTGGDNCDQQKNVKIPMFSGPSYLKFPPIDLNTQNTSISIYIKPSSESGVVLYAGPDTLEDSLKLEQFLLIYLDSGILKAKFNFHRDYHVMPVNIPVLIDRWYYIELSFVEKLVQLQVAPYPADEFLKKFKTTSKTTVDDGKLSFELFVGGLPLKNQKALFKALDVFGSFQGCMTDMLIDHFEVDMSYPDSKVLVEGYGVDSCTFNPCSENPCYNDGTCIVEDSFNYWCVCKVGFEGKLCEHQREPCEDNPCQNGGICQKQSPGFVCFCPLETKGDNCEKLMRAGENEIFMPSFNMDSYLKAEGIDILNHLDITIWLFTRKLRGLIFYAERNQDYFVLELDSLKLTFRSKIGEQVVTLTADEKLRSHTWYRVSLTAKEDTFVMSVDDSKFMVSSLYKMDSFLFRGPVYVGGFPDYSKLPAVVSTHGFRGVIQKFEINGFELIGNKTSGQVSKNFDQYFNVLGWRNHPCYDSNVCKTTERCLPDLDVYSCECRSKNCQKANEASFGSLGSQSDGSLIPISLDGSKNYVIYNSVTERLTSQNGETYRFSFRTEEQNGIIFWSKEESLIDFFVVSMWSGYLCVDIDLGADVTQTFSIHPLDDGKWHFVSIERSADWVSLKVDSEPVVKSHLSSGAWTLETDGLLWVGGMPRAANWTEANSRPGHNFIGCLSSLVVNGNPVNFYTDPLVNEVVDLCM